MKAIKFPLANFVWKGNGSDVYDLHAYNNGNSTLCCFELTDEDIAQLVATRRLYLHTFSALHFVPVAIEPKCIYPELPANAVMPQFGWWLAMPKAQLPEYVRSVYGWHAQVVKPKFGNNQCQIMRINDDGQPEFYTLGWAMLFPSTRAEYEQYCDEHGVTANPVPDAASPLPDLPIS